MFKFIASLKIVLYNNLSVAKKTFYIIMPMKNVALSNLRKYMIIRISWQSPNFLKMCMYKLKSYTLYLLKNMAHVGFIFCFLYDFHGNKTQPTAYFMGYITIQTPGLLTPFVDYFRCRLNVRSCKITHVKYKCDIQQLKRVFTMLKF